MSAIHGEKGFKIRYQSVASWRDHAVNDGKILPISAIFFTVFSDDFWLLQSLQVNVMIRRRFLSK